MLRKVLSAISSLIYRVPGSFSKKVVMIGNILIHDWRILPPSIHIDLLKTHLKNFSCKSIDDLPDLSDLDERSQTTIRSLFLAGFMNKVFDDKYFFFNCSKLLPSPSWMRCISLEREKKKFAEKYDLPVDMLDKPACCFAHGLRLLPDHVRKYVENKQFIDAGAYIGDSALSFLPYNPRVIMSFEASRPVFDMLSRNVNRIKPLCDKCKIFQMALGDYNGDLHFRDDLLSCCREDENSALTVKQTTIDNFFAGSDVPVGLIKADIEGMGLKMILGAKQTILRYRPILLIAVYHCPEEMFGIRETLKSWDAKYICRYEFLEPEFYHEMTLIAYPDELKN